MGREIPCVVFWIHDAASGACKLLTASELLTEDCGSQQYRYIDEDADEVTIASSSDLHEAIYVAEAMGGRLELCMCSSHAPNVAKLKKRRLDRYLQRFATRPRRPDHSGDPTSPADYEAQIERDLHRTLSQHAGFAPGSHGEEALRRVLVTVARDQPDVGYCQGLNFVAAFALLLARGGEVSYKGEDTHLWTSDELVAATSLVKEMITGACPVAFYNSAPERGIHQPLAGLNAAARACDDLVAAQAPCLSAHLSHVRLSANFFAVRWMPRLFVGVCSPSAVLCCWDVLVEYGIVGLVACVTALLIVHKDQIMCCADVAELVSTVDASCTEMCDSSNFAATVASLLCQGSFIIESFHQHISEESAVKVDEGFVIVSRDQEENLDSNHADGQSGDDANGSGDAFLLDNAHDTEAVEAGRRVDVWGPVLRAHLGSDAESYRSVLGFNLRAHLGLVRPSNSGDQPSDSGDQSSDSGDQPSDSSRDCRQPETEDRPNATQGSSATHAADPKLEMDHPEHECSICLDELEEGNVARLSCGHSFHPCCIEDWLNTNSESCPMCNKSIFSTGAAAVLCQQASMCEACQPKEAPEQQLSLLPKPKLKRTVSSVLRRSGLI